GDLDAIVLKAMHVDPTRRYQTANALSDDLQRYLDGRPVNARADSMGYRAHKFVRRHQLVVGLSLMAALVLSGAVVRERTLRSRAEAEARKAKAVEQYLVSVFDVADPYAPTSASGEMTARQLLDRGAARIDSVLRGESDVQAELRGSLGRVYSNLGLYSDAVPLLRQSHAQLLKVHGPQHLTVATAQDRLGLALMETNNFEESEALLRDALVTRRELLGDVQLETAESIDHLATLLQQRGKLVAADSLFREALLVRKLVHGPTHIEVANSLNNLALLLYMRSEYDQAEPYYREALAMDETLLGKDHPLTAQIVHNLAQLQRQRGLYAEAETLYRRALASKRKMLGNRHPSTTINLNNLGLLLAQDLNRPREGAVLIREALELDRSMFGEQHSFVAEGKRNLAVVLRLDGDFKAAETLLRETLVVNRRLFGPEHVRVALNLYHLGLTLHLEGRVREALPLYRASEQLYTRLVGEKDSRTNTVSIDYARALVETGELNAAEALFRRALSGTDTTSKLQRAQWIGSLTGLGDVLIRRGQGTRAQPMLERAIALSEARFGKAHWRTAEAEMALARYYLAAGATERARDLANQAASALDRYTRAQPRLVAGLAEVRRAINGHQHSWAVSRD
ncbi:MAG: tetratricopeptide repeat protein, partial [Gemmatimonas sp.]